MVYSSFSLLVVIPEHYFVKFEYFHNILMQTIIIIVTPELTLFQSVSDACFSALIRSFCIIPVKRILLFMWIKSDRLKFKDSISQYQYAMLHQLVMFACASVLVTELLWTNCRNYEHCNYPWNRTGGSVGWALCCHVGGREFNSSRTSLLG